MPGHDHSFRDTFPNLPLDDRDMFLCWCCPVREKDATIEEATVATGPSSRDKSPPYSWA